MLKTLDFQPLRWLIYIINLVARNKLPRYPHRVLQRYSFFRKLPPLFPVVGLFKWLFPEASISISYSLTSRRSRKKKPSISLLSYSNLPDPDLQNTPNLGSRKNLWRTLTKIVLRQYIQRTVNTIETLKTFTKDLLPPWLFGTRSSVSSFLLFIRKLEEKPGYKAWRRWEQSERSNQHENCRCERVCA